MQQRNPVQWTAIDVPIYNHKHAKSTQDLIEECEIMFQMCKTVTDLLK